MLSYRPRLIDATLARLLTELPGILLVGPRACGKTTTAARHAHVIARLDRPREAAAFRADPDAALAALRGAAGDQFDGTILIDEWQVVPQVMGAVKRAIDAEPRAGRFLLTGSVRAEHSIEAWPATGRVVRLMMSPLTVGERIGRLDAPLLDRLAQSTLQAPTETPDLASYVDLALTSGFPEAVALTSGDPRRRWLESYVDQLLTHDAPAVERGRDTVMLRRYLEALALNTAGIVTDKTLIDAAGVNRRTAVAYEHLLTELLVLDVLPSWFSNRLKRLVQTPKRLLTDCGLLVGSLGIDRHMVMRDGDLLGRVLETFVVSHLRAESVVAETRPRLFHLRTEHGRQEIDVVAEYGAGSTIAIEVKSTGAPEPSDARHLAWLRDALGDRFVAGAVLHTGTGTFGLGDRIVAAPISTLWA